MDKLETIGFISCLAKIHPEYSTCQFVTEFKSTLERDPSVAEKVAFHEAISKNCSSQASNAEKTSGCSSTYLPSSKSTVSPRGETTDTRRRMDALQLHTILLHGILRPTRMPEFLPTHIATDLAGNTDIRARRAAVIAVLEKLELLEPLLSVEDLEAVQQYTEKIKLSFPVEENEKEKLIYKLSLTIPFPRECVDRLVQENNRLLNENLTMYKKFVEEMEARETTFIGPPDYARMVVKHKYNTGVSKEYTAEENGWVFVQGRAENNTCLQFEVNGQKIYTGDMFFYSYTNTHQSNILFVRKGDRYKLSGGDLHHIVFYPCFRNK